MDVVKLALAIAIGIIRQHAPDGPATRPRSRGRGALAGRWSLRAAIDTALGISELAEGSDEAEADAEWRSMRATVIRWDEYYAKVPRGRLWTPADCKRRVDDLLSIAEIMQRQGVTKVGDWCAGVLAGAQGPRPEQQETSAIEWTF